MRKQCNEGEVRLERVLGVGWHNLSVQEGVALTDEMLERWVAAPNGGVRSGRASAGGGGLPGLVYFLNLDCLRLAVADAAYREALVRADLVLPDGVGFDAVVRMHGSRMRENCRGTDFAPKVLERAAALGVQVFLLGGQDGVAAQAGERLRRWIPGLKVAGVRGGYFGPEAWSEVVAQVNASGAGLLLVGMGAPLQELWLDRVRGELRVGLAMGIGGFLDVASGRIPRAPGWLIGLRLEWLWRVAMEPQRLFRRYFVDGVGFLGRVVIGRLRQRLD